MSLFVISDLHLSFGSNKPMDVFGVRWENYTERLYKNWQSVVTENDTVVMNGDLSWAMDLEGAKKDFAFVGSLNGKKIISKGNHDFWWSTASKIENFFAENGIDDISLLHNNAFVVGDLCVAGTRGWLVEGQNCHDDKITAREAMRLETSLEQAKRIGEGRETVVFLHYPVSYNGSTNEVLLSVLEKYGVKRVFYGHIHNALPNLVTREVNGIAARLVSADFLRFLPLKV